MIQSTVLFLALCAGTLVQPFRIAEAEPGHHQSYPCAAMAPDGHFAVAWVDSIASGDPFNPDDLELDLFVRFFNRDGNPMTEPYQIAKMADTNWLHYPWLEMDTAGNAVLLWVDRVTQSAEQPSYVRFQRFAPDGSPACSAHTVVARVFLYKRSPIDLSLNNRGEFAVTWLEVIPPYWDLTSVWVQRFDLDGDPENRAFLTHDVPGGDYLLPFSSPRVALNDAGDLVVTWRDEFIPRDTVYRRFQVFDAADEPILSWRPRGHLLDYAEWGKWAEPYWLDDERFVAFWVKYLFGLWPYAVVGEVFGHRGLARYPIRTVVVDEEAYMWTGSGGERDFSVAFSSDERFAETHVRGYCHEDPWLVWDHGGGVIGEIRNNEPWRQTNLFEYTPPLGKDTAYSDFLCTTTAVAACDDRIVWVYTRPNPDSILEAWAIITDWNMGVGVMES
ncbi:hypothetical protein KAX21_03885, partial [candidate division WOR-3 bacterium]|nr:hypothetical protein [candidate division WOR-3 bacterium]